VKQLVISGGCRVDYLLTDYFFIPYLADINKTRQKPIIRGDAKSVSIAAASITARLSLIITFFLEFAQVFDFVFLFFSTL